MAELRTEFPEANPNLIFHRLETANTDLESSVEQLRKELRPPSVDPSQPSALPLAEPGPGTSGLIQTEQQNINSTSDTSVAEFLSEDERNGLHRAVEMFSKVDPHFVVEQLAQNGKTLEQLVEEMQTNSVHITYCAFGNSGSWVAI